MTGPTGNVGAELVRLLADLPEPPEHRIAAHRPSSVPDPAGEVVRLDYDDRSTWPAALDGVSRLFLLFPLPTPRAVNRRILPFLDAAVTAGCEHVVYLSVFGGDTQRLIPHHTVERAIEAAPVTHTILRCSYFMQNMFRRISTHGVDVVEHGEVFVPAGRGRITFLDARDAAAVALDALRHPERHRDTGHALTGPEQLGFDRVAAILTEVLGRPVRYTSPSFPRFWARLRRRGVGLDTIAFMTGVYTLTRMGRNEPVTAELAELLGHPPRTFEQFAREEKWRWETRTWS
ncbi:MAG TPA: NmrA family NAD(P)-binding protein [Pseudonocardia sp.]|nr:NmrA family NAD(P)-binding protein [Pseudonocardia sp.]